RPTSTLTALVAAPSQTVSCFYWQAPGQREAGVDGRNSPHRRSHPRSTVPKIRPARGDVIVFVYPVDRSQTSIKRVLGVPGDHIRISRKIVYRNGTALKEPYAIHKSEYEDPYRDNFLGEPDRT